MGPGAHRGEMRLKAGSHEREITQAGVEKEVFMACWRRRRRPTWSPKFGFGGNPDTLSRDPTQKTPWLTENFPCGENNSHGPLPTTATIVKQSTAEMRRKQLISSTFPLRADFPGAISYITMFPVLGDQRVSLINIRSLT